MGRPPAHGVASGGGPRTRCQRRDRAHYAGWRCGRVPWHGWSGGSGGTCRCGGRSPTAVQGAVGAVIPVWGVVLHPADLHIGRCGAAWPAADAGKAAAPPSTAVIRTMAGRTASSCCSAWTPRRLARSADSGDLQGGGPVVVRTPWRFLPPRCARCARTHGMRRDPWEDACQRLLDFDLPREKTSRGLARCAGQQRTHRCQSNGDPDDRGSVPPGLRRRGRGFVDVGARSAAAVRFACGAEMWKVEPSPPVMSRACCAAELIWFGSGFCWPAGTAALTSATNWVRRVLM